MTPSNKDAKKTSKKILETNIALKIKEALKDIEHGDSKKVAKTIQDASKKLARRILKAAKEVDRELTKKTTAKPSDGQPKLSKAKATKVVARVKKVVAKTESGETAKVKPKITSATIPPVKQIKTAVKKSPLKAKGSVAANGKTAVKKTAKPGSVNQDEEQEKGHS